MDTDDLAAWVEALCTRHSVTLRAKGKRLEITPKSAYNALLTTEERAALKQHRATILSILNARGGVIRGTAPIETPAPAPALEPEPCRWCYASPCVGPEHSAYFDLHPEAAGRQADELATQVMMARVGRPSPFY